MPAVLNVITSRVSTLLYLLGQQTGWRFLNISIWLGGSGTGGRPLVEMIDGSLGVRGNTKPCGVNDREQVLKNNLASFRRFAAGSALVSRLGLCAVRTPPTSLKQGHDSQDNNHGLDAGRGH